MSHSSEACYKARQATPLSTPAATTQPRDAQTSTIERPADVPGLLSNMVHVEATIDGVKVKAFIDTGAAATVCVRQVAYTICMNGEAVFREGASHLLSLTAFGGSKVHLNETFFAT